MSNPLSVIPFTLYTLKSNHPLFLWNGKHLLRVTLVRNEQGLQIPIFQLVQQPSPVLKYSYESNPEAFALIHKENLKESFEMENKVIIEAMPLSFRFARNEELEAFDVPGWNTRTTVEDISGLKPVELDKLTKFDRQRSWYIDVRNRPSGTNKDTFYIHLQSKLKVRSKVEVYYFIKTGKRPTQGDTSTITSGEGSKKIRGKQLVESREAGFYDHENKKIYRRPIMPFESESKPSKKIKTDGRNEKRRRSEEGSSAEEVKDPKNATSSAAGTPKVYTLYDFQTLV